MNSRVTIALHIVGFLASRDGEPLTSERLARTYGTSPVVLRRVLAQLQHAGLVRTQRGKGGGAVLARDAEDISLKEVFEAVSQDLELIPRHPGDGEGGARSLKTRRLVGLCRPRLKKGNDKRHDD